MTIYIHSICSLEKRYRFSAASEAYVATTGSYFLNLPVNKCTLNDELNFNFSNAHALSLTKTS